MTQTNSTPGMDMSGMGASVQQPIQPASSGSGKGVKIIILIMVLLFCCLVTSVAGFAGWKYYDNEQKKDNEKTQDQDRDNQPTATAKPDNTLTPTKPSTSQGDDLYENDTYGFTMSLPSTWTVSELGDSVEILSDNGGRIDFKAYEDANFAFLSEIDQDFCDSFGEGFREGLGDVPSAGDFFFTLFTLNGNKGCRAEGQIYEGIYQQYYVFFNPDNDTVYAIFYTTSSRTEEQDLKAAMDTFDF